MDDFLIVGSGPTGVAFATAALARGASVHMVDVGNSLEAARSDVIAQAATSSPDEWEPEVRKMLRYRPGSADGLSRKLAFGSDFPYAEASTSLCDVGIAPDVGCVVSYARGGMSNVWGAAVEPLQATIDRLPEWMERPMLEAEEAVNKFLPCSRITNDGSRFSIPALPVIEGLRQRMSVSSSNPEISITPATVAVDAFACLRCRTCLMGCVYGAIWHAGMQLDWLLSHPRFRYSRRLLALRFEETGSQAQLVVRRCDTLDEHVITSRRLVLAAGALGSATLIVRSGVANELSLTDYQTFFLPIVLPGRTRGVRTAPGLDLSQVFMRHCRVDGAGETMIQLYGYNDTLAARLPGGNHPLAQRFSPISERLLAHVAVGIGYLGAPVSGGLRILRLPDGGCEVSAVGAPSRGNAIQSMEPLVRALRQGGAVPVKRAMRLAQVGEGYHLSTLVKSGQMAVSLENGLLDGTNAIHVVDSGALPHVAPGPITKLAMCNSTRLASEVCA